MKVLVSAFNKEKALVWAVSVIVKTDGSFAALVADMAHLAAEAAEWREAGLRGRTWSV